LLSARPRSHLLLLSHLRPSYGSPTLQALRNRALKERHWTKVFEAIGQVFARDANFTLQVGAAVRTTRESGHVRHLCHRARPCVDMGRGIGMSLVVAYVT
jgi:hypothetical protein